MAVSVTGRLLVAADSAGEMLGEHDDEIDREDDGEDAADRCGPTARWDPPGARRAPRNAGPRAPARTCRACRIRRGALQDAVGLRLAFRVLVAHVAVRAWRLRAEAACSHHRCSHLVERRVNVQFGLRSGSCPRTTGKPVEDDPGPARTAVIVMRFLPVSAAVRHGPRTFALAGLAWQRPRKPSAHDGPSAARSRRREADLLTNVESGPARWQRVWLSPQPWLARTRATPLRVWRAPGFYGPRGQTLPTPRPTMPRLDTSGAAAHGQRRCATAGTGVLNEKGPARARAFDSASPKTLSATRARRRSARRSPPPPPWPARRGACGP